VAVEETELRDRIGDLHVLQPPPKPHEVPRKATAPSPRDRLPCVHRFEANLPQTVNHPGRRDEPVACTRRLTRLRGEDCRRSLPQVLLAPHPRERIRILRIDIEIHRIGIRIHGRLLDES
jgi:hypothetical protein